VNLSNHRNILIIRLSSLGDVILTTPLIRSLKKVYPEKQIDFVVREQYQDVLRYNPHLNNVFTLDKDNDYARLFDKIGSDNYDLIIDLHNNVRSRVISGKIGAKTVRYKKPYLKRGLLVNTKINLLKDAKKIPERYAGALNESILDKEGPEIHLPQNSSTILDDSGYYIGICPGSKHFTKMYPIDYISDLITMLQDDGFRIVLFGGTDDKVICDQIKGSGAEIVNLCNDNDLLQTAAEMKKCKLVICNDSGLMHAATAVNIPVAAIFGSTVRELGFTPYNSEHILIENNNIGCRPCSHIGRNACPKKHFKCMLELTPELVFKKVKNFIGEL
jgi:heptosyltransferase-2